VTLHLVRHGRPLIDPTAPASAWELDPDFFDDVWALRDRLPASAAWFSSPEPKALATAQLLTDTDVGVVDELREHERGVTSWFDDETEWHAAVRTTAPGRAPRTWCWSGTALLGLCWSPSSAGSRPTWSGGRD
jgi:broad specificity phosphatase PhoE